MELNGEKRAVPTLTSTCRASSSLPLFRTFDKETRIPTIEVQHNTTSECPSSAVSPSSSGSVFRGIDSITPTSFSGTDLLSRAVKRQQECVFGANERMMVLTTTVTRAEERRRSLDPFVLEERLKEGSLIDTRLPNEILCIVFNFLSTKELLSIALVSKRWMALANDFALRCYRASYGSSNGCDSKANWANFYHQTVSVYGSPSISYANKILDTNLALRAARYGHEKLVIRMLSYTKSTIKADLITALALYAIQGGHTHFISSVFEYAFTRSPKLLQGVDFHFLFLGAVRENQLRVAILLRCYSNIYVNDCEGTLWRKNPNPSILGPYWRSFAQTSNVTALGICLSLQPPDLEMKRFLFSLGATWADQGFCLFSNIPCAQLAIVRGYIDFVKEIAASYRGSVTKPLLLASARNPHVEVFNLIASKYTSPLPVTELLTMAIYSSESGEVTVMIRHLTSLASMEAKSSSLMVALRNSRYPIAKYLLDSGANINHSEQNVTAFLKAISLSLDQTFLISLLDYHPDLDSKTPDGETTLSLAVSKNLRRFVQTLLATGKVNSQLKGGLLTAVRSHATDLAEVLIQEGADVSVCDKYHNNVIHILMQYYPPRSRFSFLFFLEAYHRDYLKELVNKRNSEGNTPLHLLLGRDADPTTIQTLLSYGASVNIPNHAGKTPQSLAQNRRILPLLFSDTGGTNGSRGNGGNGDHTSGALSRHSSCAIQ